MFFQQIARPNLNAQDGAGWCLRHTQRVFNAPAMYPDAWTAWNNQSGRRTDALPTDVSVPVWFEHWGTYNGQYKNWGHVATWVPGRGIYSSPRQGYGGEWFSSIREIEQQFNARYVGWTTSMHGMPIVREVSSPAKPLPKPRQGGNFMKLIDTAAYLKDKNRPGHRWVLMDPGTGYWLETRSKTVANRWATLYGDSTRVSGVDYRAWRKDVQHGM